VFCGITFIGLLCLRWLRAATTVVVSLAAIGAVLLELSQSVDADAGNGVDGIDLVLTVVSAALASLVLWRIARR